MKAELLSVTGEVIEVTPKNGTNFELSEIQEFVGGYIERVVCPDGREMYINEEGKLLGLNINAKATKLSGVHRHGDAICGHAIIGPRELFEAPED